MLNFAMPDSPNTPYFPTNLDDARKSTHNRGILDLWELKAFRFLALDAFSRSEWIGQTLNHFLPNVAYQNIVVLGPGMGEELLHIRTRHPDAKITAFDIRDDDELGLRMYDITNTFAITGGRGDYAILDKCLRNVPGEPDLLICRNPRIFASTPTNKYDVMYDDVIVNAVCRWVIRAKELGSDVLLTFMIAEEATRVRNNLAKRGLHVDLMENPYRAEFLRLTTEVQGVRLTGSPDEIVIRV